MSSSSPRNGQPVVAVLLATYNGGRYLDEQLTSLLDQQDVETRVVASDDRSSDDTVQQLRARAAATDRLVLLPACDLTLGNANRNFMRLIHDAPVGDAAYVAFSDQDDIWLKDKLKVAVQRLAAEGADGYSSNITAFWPDGRRQLLMKSQPQRARDHFFESAGAGCTFVLTRRAFDQLRSLVRSDYEKARALRIHDWTIYAFVRERGMRWIIDDRSAIEYRQHGQNELGANVGVRAARSRWRQLRDGSFRREALAMADALRLDHEVFRRLRRLSPIDRLVLASQARDFRRRRLDAWMLALFFLVTRKQ